MKFELTKHGIGLVEHYILELKAKRKEILDAGKDTADETTLPTAEDILSDVSFTGIIWDDPNGPCYYNGWAVTDNYDADLPICLKLGRDLIVTDESFDKVFVYKQYRDDLAYGEEEIVVFTSKDAAIKRLKTDVGRFYGMKWENIPDSLPIEKEDTFIEDYVSIVIPDVATKYWIIEEHKVEEK